MKKSYRLIKHSNFSKVYFTKVGRHNVIERAMQSPLDSILGRHNAIERAMRSPLDSIIGRHNVIERAMQSPLDSILGRHNAIERAMQSPLDSIIGRYNAIERAMRSPLDSLGKHNAIERAMRSPLDSIIGRHNAIERAMQSPLDSILGKHNAIERAMQQLQTDWYRQLQNKVEHLPKDVQIEFEHQKQLYKLAQQQQWFLDDDLVIHLLDLNVEQSNVFDEKAAIEYVSQHFDSYITTITSANCYETHKNIILQSAIAFSNQQYELAIFPLFAAFDNVFSRWYKEELSRPYEYSDVFIRGLWKKINEILETTNFNDNRDSNKLLNGLNIIQAYLDLFTTYPENIAKLNRNSILHGSYNYTLLSSTSYLKMIVLLQSAISLENIPFQSMQ